MLAAFHLPEGMRLSARKENTGDAMLLTLVALLGMWLLNPARTARNGWAVTVTVIIVAVLALAECSGGG